MSKSAATPCCTAREHLRGAKIGDDFLRTRTPWFANSAPWQSRDSAKWSVIGGDGLGFAKQKDAPVQDGSVGGGRSRKTTWRYKRTPVSIVPRLANPHRRGTKLDDLVLIGTPRRLAQHHALRAGRSGWFHQIGSNCILAGQVGTAGHFPWRRRRDHAQSGVPNDVPSRSLYSGYPAVENREWLKTMAALNRCLNCRNVFASWKRK